MKRPTVDDVTARAQAAFWAELEAEPGSPERARLKARTRRLFALRRAHLARED